MDVTAVIPLKDPAQGKARLSRALATPQRIELIRAMLAHVADCLAETPAIASVSVLTSGPHLVPRGCGYISDRGLELNAAVAHAAREVRSRGTAGTLLVVHADLPFVTSDEIGALIAASGEDVVVAAPDWAESGTNALAFPLSRDVTTRFGAGSLAAHGDAAHAAGLPLVLVRRPGLAEDIDEPAQLRALADRGGSRYAFLSDAQSVARS
ncbi:MAG: 2-phospho-L-lactate guanylyltransferase [Steroidobacteraceae bacterium]